jgi:hypothetical protein
MGSPNAHCPAWILPGGDRHEDERVSSFVIGGETGAQLLGVLLRAAQWMQPDAPP